MKLPLGFGVMDFGDWAYGLASAIISGGSNAIGIGVVVPMIDPDHFAFGTGRFLALVGATFLMSGVTNAANFLAKRPLPAFRTVETTVQETSVKGHPVESVTTVKETVVEQAQIKSPADGIK